MKEFNLKKSRVLCALILAVSAIFYQYNVYGKDGMQNVYDLTNSYYIEKIKSSYKNEIKNATCKINEDFRQIEVKNLTITALRPVLQAKINDIQNEATYLAFYKVITDCYPNISKELALEIFDKMQNQDIDSLFTERNKTYNMTQDSYQASFDFVLKKDSVDFFIWKYGQSQIITNKDGYIIVTALIYDPKDTMKIETFLKNNNITFKVLEYRSTKATYSIKVDGEFNKIKNDINQTGVSFVAGENGFAIEIKN